jgi:hypothetical protein
VLRPDQRAPEDSALGACPPARAPLPGRGANLVPGVPGWSWDQVSTAGGAGHGGPRHDAAPRSGPWRAGPGGVLAIIAVLLMAAAAAFTGGRATAGAVAELTGLGRSGPQRPALPADASATPLGTAERPPAGSGGYRFLGVQDDGSARPVRWDPCRPIHYVVRAGEAPPGGDAAIRSAVTTMERTTGLQFVYDGTTTEAPVPNRPSMDVARYGQRWSPVLVAWTDPAEYPDMEGYAGLGGPDTVAGDETGTRRYVSGVVLLNRSHLADVATWPDGRPRLRAVVLHEFGHLLGLDHVDDARQLMNVRPAPVTRLLGDGDRRGLAELGGGPCFRDF